MKRIAGRTVPPSQALAGKAKGRANWAGNGCEDLFQPQALVREAGGKTAPKLGSAGQTRTFLREQKKPRHTSPRLGRVGGGLDESQLANDVGRGRADLASTQEALDGFVGVGRDDAVELRLGRAQVIADEFAEH